MKNFLNKTMFLSLFLFLNLAILNANEKPANRLRFGIDSSYRSYSEQIEGDGKSDEYGHIHGFNLGYDYIQKDKIYYGTDLNYKTGVVTYDGSLQNLATGQITPYKDKTRSHLFDLEGRIGYTLQPRERLLVTPFLGLGYHNWYRGASQNLANDYSETYDWYYLSAGVRNIYAYSETVDLGLNLKAMHMIDGIMTASNQSEAFKLGNKLHFEVETPVLFQGFSKFNVQVTPYFRYQPIGKSPVVASGFYEPSSNTYDVGTRIELVHLF